MPEPLPVGDANRILLDRGWRFHEGDVIAPAPRTHHETYLSTKAGHADLDLIDDAALIAAYEARHAPDAVWPGVIRDIRDRGYLDIEIWRVDDRLVMIAEVTDDFPRPSDPNLVPLVERWEAEMSAFQRPLQTATMKWSPLHRIFALSEQTGRDCTE